MNKLNPESIAAEFESSVDHLLAYYRRSDQNFRNTPTGKSDISLLNEQVFLYAAIAFEGALSDLYFAFINKDSSVFFSEKERKIKEEVGAKFGDWYSSKVSIPHIKHLKAGDLYPLIDPRGFNITFQNSRSMVAKARKNLLPEYAGKYRALSPSQRKLSDCVKQLRNYVAHRSDSGFDSMTKALASLANGPYDVLSRTPSMRVQSVGAYLKARAGAVTRTEFYLQEMKAIVNAIGH